MKYITMIKEGWFGKDKTDKIGLTLGYLGAFLIPLCSIYVLPSVMTASENLDKFIGGLI